MESLFKCKWLPADYQRMLVAAQETDNPALTTMIAGALELEEKLLHTIAHNRDQFRALARSITDYINGVETQIPFNPSTFETRAHDTAVQFWRCAEIYNDYMSFESAIQEVLDVPATTE
jgi:hypothetical protein